MTKPRFGVVYLARKIDGLRHLPRFIASLCKNPAGSNYDLIVILKGFSEGETPRGLAELKADGLISVHIFMFDDSRFATEAFFTVAERFDYEAFLFFVSSARVEAKGWARIVFSELVDHKAMLVGASAGVEQLDTSTPFPNPSIRTTGFAMRRDDWLALDRGDLSMRFGGNLFEAGPHSMTKQVMGGGGIVVVVGRNGCSYAPETWVESATFRLSRQENLLFSDKRTDQFELARSAKRRHLVAVNWGPNVPVVEIGTSIVYLRRVREMARRFWWKTAGVWVKLS